MAVKSIIDVEVNSKEFERFQDLFGKYSDQLAKTPSAWAKVSKENMAVSKNFEKMAAALMAQNKMSQEAAAARREEARHLERNDRLWTSMAKSTKSVASNIIGATRSLLQWTGILGAVGGLLGAGGLFGIDRMAALAASQRRGAMGLGLSTGEQKAFGINFGSLVDPGSYLSWVNQMETDPTKAWAVSALGGRLTGRTGADAVSLLESLRSRARATPLNQLGLLPQQYGLEGVSVEDLRRLRDMGNPEFAKLKAGYGRDALALNIPDNVGAQWASFTRQMERAGGEIFKIFVVGLTKLEGPLEHLSSAFVKFLGVIMAKNGIVEEGITKVANWLESFSGKISAPAFLEAVQRFTSDIGDLADAVHAIVHPWDTASKKLDPLRSYFAPNADDLRNDPRVLARALDTANRKAGLAPGFLETIRQLESSGDPNAVKLTRRGAAMGLFGFMPETWRQYGGSGSPFSPGDSALAAQRLGSHLVDKYGDNLAAEFAAWNAGEGAVDAAMSQAKLRGGDWRRYLPRETRNYLSNAQPIVQGFQAPGVRIEMFNNTGGAAGVSISQLAH